MFTFFSSISKVFKKGNVLAFFLMAIYKYIVYHCYTSFRSSPGQKYFYCPKLRNRKELSCACILKAEMDLEDDKIEVLTKEHDS